MYYPPRAAGLHKHNQLKATNNGDRLHSCSGLKTERFFIANCSLASVVRKYLFEIVQLTIFVNRRVQSRRCQSAQQLYSSVAYQHVIL